MKLNNKGWGLTDYLLIVGALTIALFGASILIIRLNNTLKENMKKNEQIEENIDENTKENIIDDNNNEQNAENDKKEEVQESIDYRKIEDKMVNAAMKYIEGAFKNEISNNTITVDNAHLIELDSALKDEMSKDNCKGYVLVKKDEKNINYTPYVKCDNYKTEGTNDYYIN